jgi:acyl-CoA thioester hydrolase
MDLVSAVPRPHPARLTLSTYPMRHPLEARYADMDSNGHLNNLALEAMHENTRATLNRGAFPGVYENATRRLRLVVANHVVHFLRESHWPATIDTAGGVGRIGRTSYVIATALFLDGECVSLCDTVLVVLGDDGPESIPEDARERLSALLLRA